MTRLSLILLAALVLWLPSGTHADALPEDEKIDLEALAEEREKKIKRWGVDNRTSKRLSDGIELLEAQKYDEARAKLERVSTRRSNPYERALAHRLLAYVAFGEESYEEAVAQFELVLEQEALPVSDEAGIRFNIAQLYTAQQDWTKVVDALDLWFRYVDEPDPVAFYLKAIAYYQLDDPEKALPPAQKAVALAPTPREAWLQLLAALYTMREDFRSATPVLEQLVTSFPKKNYWVQLSLIYATLENYRDSLAVQQLAYAQGLLTEDKELRRLARTFLYQGLPYPAAIVLEKGLDAEVIDADVEALQLLANSWIAARDYDRSLAPLQRAALLSEDGEIFVRLGQVHIQREEWSHAVTQLRKGLEKGGLEDVGMVQLVLGVALYNDARPDPARVWFERAARHESPRAQARAWLDILDRESAELESPTELTMASETN